MQSHSGSAIYNNGTAQCCYNTKVQLDGYYRDVLLFVRVALDSVAQTKLNLIFRDV